MTNLDIDVCMIIFVFALFPAGAFIMEKKRIKRRDELYKTRFEAGRNKAIEWLANGTLLQKTTNGTNLFGDPLESWEIRKIQENKYRVLEVGERNALVQEVALDDHQTVGESFNVYLSRLNEDYEESK